MRIQTSREVLPIGFFWRMVARACRPFSSWSIKSNVFGGNSRVWKLSSKTPRKKRRNNYATSKKRNWRSEKRAWMRPKNELPEAAAELAKLEAELGTGG